MSKIVEIVKAHGPIKRAALARRAGVTERRLRMVINSLNDQGVPLVFTGKGFIYASKRSDLKMWAKNQKNAALSILKKVAAVTKSDVEGIAWGLFT